MSTRRIFSLVLGIFVVVVLLILASACASPKSYSKKIYKPIERETDSKFHVTVVCLLMCGIVFHFTGKESN